MSPIFWQRNLNLCVSARSSSESRRPLDVISVCTRPGQHVTDCLGEYQPQVTGEEFGLGVRWRLALTSIRVPGPSLGNPPVVVFSLWLGVVGPFPDSSVAHSVCRGQWHSPCAADPSQWHSPCAADPSHVARPCFGFQGSTTFPLWDLRVACCRQKVTRWSPT